MANASISRSLTAPEMSTLYPAPMKQAAGTVDGVLTNVMALYFSDKIMVMIMQDGRLAQWIQVPMDLSNPARGENYLPSSEEDDLLPMPNLTARTLLGGASEERETVGQLYATQIATAIATKMPDEQRTILFGFGFLKAHTSREQFFDLLDLIMQCL